MHALINKNVYNRNVVGKLYLLHINIYILVFVHISGNFQKFMYLIKFITIYHKFK